jgi:hypothetical protein
MSSASGVATCQCVRYFTHLNERFLDEFCALEGAYLINCSADTHLRRLIRPLRGLYMKNLFIPLALLLALSVPALAQDNQGGNNQGQNNDNQGGGAHGAPGPLMSAGLPVLLIGGGIYLMVRRKKR